MVLPRRSRADADEGEQGELPPQLQCQSRADAGEQGEGEQGEGKADKAEAVWGAAREQRSRKLCSRKQCGQTQACRHWCWSCLLARRNRSRISASVAGA
mmetsp:Transcript_116016/g.248004  ORF Transcript_116016/g.248004 Transcript_116016/m.248004 type:complete len:99 (-) Transcript_116016:10-306(-)